MKKMFLKLQVKLMCTTLLLMAVVLTNCMGKPAKKVPESPYSVGVIDSSDSGKTYLYLLDENLKETDTLRCPYHGVGSFGKTPVQILDGVLYEQWEGGTMHSYKCAVAAMDLETGKWKDYSFKGEGSIRDFRVNEHGIFVLSSSKDAAVDYYSFADGSSVTVKVKDAWGALAISVSGYDVYFISEEWDTVDVETAYITEEDMEEDIEEDIEEHKKFLYHVNVKEQSQEKLLDVTEELGECIMEYTQWYEGKMYIPDNGSLFVYDADENKIHGISFSEKESRDYNVHVDGERLYIVDGNADDEGETDVYRFNPETEEVEAAYHFAEQTLQSYMKDGILYTLEQYPTVVRKYELSPDGTYRKLGEAAIDSENGNIISDMFVK